MTTRKLLTWIVIAVAASGAAVSLVIWHMGSEQRTLARGVSEVDPGILFRSGQPEEESLQTLHDRHQLRTVINLRENTPGSEWQEAEMAFCRANDIRYVQIELTGAGFTEPQLAEFLSLVSDPASRPVLVHCQHGRTRTGYVVAAYRMLVQHWSYAEAEADAAQYGFRSDEYTGLEASLRALAARAAADGGPAHATPSRR